MLIPAIADPVAEEPILPLLVFVPDGITMPLDIVIPASISPVRAPVGVALATAATGLLFHSIVTAPRLAVGMGFMSGVDVMVDDDDDDDDDDRWARAIGAAATRARVTKEKECISIESKESDGINELNARTVKVFDEYISKRVDEQGRKQM